ncbi:MAG TPA: fused MFS/spermidine synthase, partial [Thermoanaerobaculia bacterium]|nr:fused MFS/spermidine synthase [Thermoanaerobaculia bacterium]
GLLPLLTAPGVWRLVVILLLALAALTTLAGLRAGAPRRAALTPAAAGALGLLLCLATGPTAFWRHSPIGAGRMETTEWKGPNDIRDQVSQMRQRVTWEREGVESSVALDLTTEYSLIVNGKSDGTATADAPTQVLSGLIGSMVHPYPKRVLVIGLGTGSTAGWMAQVPSVERVDVVELEPAIEHVARVLSKINLDVLANPKVHLYMGDGRELLLATGDSYDLIFSEPSNPYRAGVASLYSQDFYRAVLERLRPGGLFLQWLQGYETDFQMVRTVYATLGSVFPAVESWQTHRVDLMLMASREPVVHDLGLVRARAATEPYRTALSSIWGVEGAEGFYSAYLANPSFARAVGEMEGTAVNTDDRPILEFGFAKNLGRFGLFQPADLHDLAASRRENRPATRGAPLDWTRVGEARVARAAWWGESLPAPASVRHPAARLRIAARHAWVDDSLAPACSHWFRQPEPPRFHVDQLLVGECLAAAGDPRAPDYAARLAREQPVEADLVLAQWHAAAGRLLAACDGLRRDPWVSRFLVQRVLPKAVTLARQDPALGPRLHQALEQPFAVRMFERQRLITRVWLAQRLNAPELCAGALAPFEPHSPWDESFLRYRHQCYRKLRHPLEDRARRDLESFLAQAPPRLGEGLEAPRPSS